MKILFAVLALSSLTAFANDTVGEGKPCRLEGERAYLTNKEDSRNHDVYVCEEGVWTFLYTREWNEGQE